MNTKSEQTRPAYFRGSPPKYPEIVKSIRSRIFRGELESSARLPTRLELQKSFGTTSATIQKALTQLAAEGFTEARGRYGTFVVQHPPHLNRYALIFPNDPTDLEPGGWSQFYATLVNEATKIQQTENRQFECFYGINGPIDTANYHRLVSKMKAHQFAGLIFTAHPHWLLGTSLVEWEGVARVGLMTHDVAFPKIPAVWFNYAAWFEKAFDYLVSRGRKRVAFVSKASPKSMIELECPPSLLAARGLTTRPYWNLPLPMWTEGAAHIVQLLMQSAGERPDALVITDDNVVEPTVAGLMAAGVRVPDDVEVVAHANFPRSGPRVLPLQWLGHDIHEVLRACIAIVDQQCRGEKPPDATTIAPVFEEELTTRKTATELSPVQSS